MDPKDIKLVFVGSSKVGKTSCMITYFNNSFPFDYLPTVFENETYPTFINKQKFQVSPWDTSGHEDYDRLRPISYCETSVFLLLYDISNRQTFNAIEEKWIKEIREHCPDTPVILVGHKTDLKQEQKKKKKEKEKEKEESVQLQYENNPLFVTKEEGEQMALKIGATKFYECSSKMQLNLDGVFKTAILAAYEYNQNKSQGWLKKKFLLRTPKLPSPFPKPQIVVKPTTLQQDYQDLVIVKKKTKKKMKKKKNNFSDLIFILKNNKEDYYVYSHKSILSSRSTIFSQIFQGLKENNQKFLEDFGLELITGLNQENENITFLKVSHDFSCFLLMLYFFYCGRIVLYPDTQLSQTINPLNKLSKLFGIDELIDFCNWYLEYVSNSESENEKENKSENDLKIKEKDNLKEKNLEDPIIQNEIFKSNHKWFQEFENKTKEKLIQDYLSMFNKSIYSNFQIIINSKKNKKKRKSISVQKEILIIRSKYFKNLFQIDMKEKHSGTLKIEHFSLKTMKSFLQYLYTGFISVENDNELTELLQTADYFQNPRLKTQCEIKFCSNIEKMKKIEKHQNKIINIFKMGQTVNANQLVNYCAWLIGKNYIKFKKKKLLRGLSIEGKKLIKEKRYPPKEYEKYNNKVKVKFAKKFGLVREEPNYD
ncbi:rho-related protein racd-related [Anaeramoeba flamelloides]|uniref:Rho-related protein racd-related n=1 Tax=Anaeramoeba flamelloides TaxID=1746091 RepID=A0AAV7Y8N9_9EUKA|nr:rho-related protein racd-related [Anaeramoeba flamelloides]